MKQTSRRRLAFALAIVATVTLFVLLADTSATSLQGLQTGGTFKLMTGVGLIAYLGAMWMMPSRRLLRRRTPPRSISIHLLLGLLGPIILLTHTIRFGYGYTALLCVTYLLLLAMGAWNCACGPRVRRLSRGLHAMVAVALVPLIVLHIAVSAYY